MLFDFIHKHNILCCPFMPSLLVKGHTQILFKFVYWIFFILKLYSKIILYVDANYTRSTTGLVKSNINGRENSIFLRTNKKFTIVSTQSESATSLVPSANNLTLRLSYEQIMCTTV